MFARVRVGGPLQHVVGRGLAPTEERPARRSVAAEATRLEAGVHQPLATDHLGNHGRVLAGQFALVLRHARDAPVEPAQWRDHARRPVAGLETGHRQVPGAPVHLAKLHPLPLALVVPLAGVHSLAEGRGLRVASPHHVHPGAGETLQVLAGEDHAAVGRLNREADVNGPVARVLGVAPHAVLTLERIPVVPVIRVGLDWSQVLVEVPGHHAGSLGAQFRALVAIQVREYQQRPRGSQILVVRQAVEREALRRVVGEDIHALVLGKGAPPFLPARDEMLVQDAQILVGFGAVLRVEALRGADLLDELGDGIRDHAVMDLIFAGLGGGGPDEELRARDALAGDFERGTGHKFEAGRVGVFDLAQRLAGGLVGEAEAVGGDELYQVVVAGDVFAAAPIVDAAVAVGGGDRDALADRFEARHIHQPHRVDDVLP